MKKQILIAGVFLSSLIMGCTQDEALETLSNESSLINEIKKVETLFADNMQKEKDESAYSNTDEKIETSMSLEDRLVYYDYINRNGIGIPTSSMKTASRGNVPPNGFGLVLKPKGVRCYPYDELILVMDCEDHREKSSVSGNTGETFVDGNGNVHFFFCVVPGDLSYGGGLSEREADFYRFFDCEDSDNDTRLYSNGMRLPRYQLDTCTFGIKGDSKGNVTFYFNLKAAKNPDIYGRFGMGPKSSSKGIIYTDDEDNNNTNHGSWIKGSGILLYPNDLLPIHNHNTSMNVYF